MDGASSGTAQPGRRAAQVVLAGVCVVAGCGLAVWLVPAFRPLAVPTCWAFLPAWAVILAAAVRFAASGPGRAPPAALAAGWAVVVGGAAADIVATLKHTPDLAREANPIARTLLDAGTPLAAVFAYAAVGQALLVATACALWLAVLRHRGPLGASMPAEGSSLAYFKAATGGRELSYRQWLLPLKPADLPWAYHLALVFGALFAGAGAYRFYLALEWFGIAPADGYGPARVTAMAASTLVPLGAYVVWLRGLGRRNGGITEPTLEAAR